MNHAIDPTLCSFAFTTSACLRPCIVAVQVLETTKGLSHVIKVSSCGLHGGEDWGAQRRKLQGEIDIVVASPGRLLQHYEKGHLFFSQVSHWRTMEIESAWERYK